jgi:hypothetical protein
MQVVTLADLSVEGSRIFANNMQPARKPSTRNKIAHALAKLVSSNKDFLDRAPQDVSKAAAVGGGEGVDATFVAALKGVVESKAGGEKASDLAACLTLSFALCKSASLSERAMVISDAALAAWKAGAASWASAAEEFMAAMNAAVASVLEDANNAATLLGGVTKESASRLPDVVDGYIYVYTFTLARTRARAHTRTNTRTHAHSRTHTYMCMCVCVCMYTHTKYTHVCVCVCMYTHTTFIHTNTQTHTGGCSLWSWRAACRGA